MKNLKLILGALVVLILVLTFCKTKKTAKDETISLAMYKEVVAERDSFEALYNALKKEQKTPELVGYVTTEDHQKIMDELLECRISNINNTNNQRVKPPTVIVRDTVDNTQEVITFYDNLLDDSYREIEIVQHNLDSVQSDLETCKIEALIHESVKIYKGTIEIEEPSATFKYTAQSTGTLSSVTGEFYMTEIPKETKDLSKRDNYLGVSLGVATKPEERIIPLPAVEYIKLLDKSAWGLAVGVSINTAVPNTGVKLTPYAAFKYGIRF